MSRLYSDIFTSRRPDESGDLTRLTAERGGQAHRQSLPSGPGTTTACPCGQPFSWQIAAHSA